MSTFSREEITFFREQYANHLRANARGVDVEGFLSAIDLCIDYARLQSPGRDNLRADFNKIKNTDGNVSWPQFFQVSFFTLPARVSRPVVFLASLFVCSYRKRQAFKSMSFEGLADAGYGICRLIVISVSRPFIYCVPQFGFGTPSSFKTILPSWLEYQGQFLLSWLEYQGQFLPSWLVYQGQVLPSWLVYQGQVLLSWLVYQGQVLLSWLEYQGQFLPSWLVYQGQVLPSWLEYQGQFLLSWLVY